MSWYLERNYDWVIRKKWYLKIIDTIFCKGIMTDIAQPQTEVLQKRRMYRLFNRITIVNWFGKPIIRSSVRRN